MKVQIEQKAPFVEVCTRKGVAANEGLHPVCADGRPRTKGVVLAHLDPQVPFVPPFLVNFLLKVASPFAFRMMKKVRSATRFSFQPQGRFFIYLQHSSRVLFGFGGIYTSSTSGHAHALTNRSKQPMVLTRTEGKWKHSVMCRCCD